MVMATSLRTATARLCRAPGFWSVISRSPASIRRRRDSLIWRVDSAAQSIVGISSNPPRATRASRRRPSVELPHARGAGGSLACPVPAAERSLKRDLLVGDGDGVRGLPDDQGLQAEGVLRESERVRGRGQVAEAPVEIAHRGAKRLT